MRKNGIMVFLATSILVNVTCAFAETTGTPIDDPFRLLPKSMHDYASAAFGVSIGLYALWIVVKMGIVQLLKPVVDQVQPPPKTESGHFERDNLFTAIEDIKTAFTLLHERVQLADERSFDLGRDINRLNGEVIQINTRLYLCERAQTTVEGKLTRIELVLKEQP